MAAEGWSFPLELDSGDTVNILRDPDGFAFLTTTGPKGTVELKVSLVELQILAGIVQSITAAGGRLMSAAALKAAAAAAANATKVTPVP
jgi:hypothetical protein